MKLGEEFTFHGSINKPAVQEGAKMFRFELNHGAGWFTMQASVTEEWRDKVTPLLSKGNEGKTWRFVDLSKPERKPRVRKATKPAQKPSEGTEKAEPKARTTRATKTAQNGSEAAKEGASK